MTLRHFSKRQNRSKNEIRKITVKSRNDVKSAFFDMFYVISQPFLKISTWNCAHILISHFPVTYSRFFEEKHVLRVKQILKKKKKLKILEIFKIFKISNIWNIRFVALLILRHFI